MRPGHADALVSEVVGDLPRGQGGGVGPGRDEVAEGVRVQALPFGAGDVIDLRPAERQQLPDAAARSGQDLGEVAQIVCAGGRGPARYARGPTSSTR